MLVPVTPKTSSVMEQLNDLWPSGSPPDTLFVLSPFFDQGVTNQPAQKAWDMLRRRGGAEISFSVVAEPIRASEKLLVHAPPSLATSFPTDGRTGEIVFQRLQMPGGRSLHAKSLWLENTDHFLHCIGSSNFTSAGMGVGGIRNWELNVASWARVGGQEYELRDAAWPEHEDDPLDPEAVNWQPEASLEDEPDPLAPRLPDWCGSAVYFVRAGGGAALELNFIGIVPGAWTITHETDGQPLLTAEEWRTAGSLARVEIAWKDARPPTELLVKVDAGPEASWPVEVRAFSDLPPPQELRDLTLEQLLEILTSALPLHRCLRKLWRRNDDELSAPPRAATLDPLNRFGRENHLLERTRRFSLAMTGVRKRLESPMPSEEYLQWRLHGPIGVSKVAAAILKEAKSDGEKAFLIGELALELSRLEPKSEPGYLSKNRIRQAIGSLVIEFERQAAPLLATTESSLQDYVRTALRRALE
jgi:hypothetical protein